MLLQKGDRDFPEIAGLILCAGCGQGHFVAECIHVQYRGFNTEGESVDYDFIVCANCLTKRVIPFNGCEHGNPNLCPHAKYCGHQEESS